MGTRSGSVLVAAASFVAGLSVLGGCDDPPPGRTYFEREIEPILVQSCASNTSGCHSTNANDPFQFAAGNLDVTSYDAIQKRRDVLSPFGAYPESLLLIKAVGPGQLNMQYGYLPNTTMARFLSIDVQHAGGGIIDPGSDAYFTLKGWLENGATENGLKPPTPARNGDGKCSTSVRSGFMASQFVNPMTQANFEEFKSKVQPILKDHGCTDGNCHGAPQSDFYITCGDSEEQLAFNFSQAWSFVNSPVDDSQLLRVPLAVAAGGRGHTGGDQFASNTEADYTAIKEWAATIGKLEFANGDAGKEFFEQNVQPVLLTRGCTFQACHSPAAGNDFKLRSGAVGFLSAVALEKNYELLRDEFLAIEFPDARRGRAVAKTILEQDTRTVSVGGIPHRGGPVLETPSEGAQMTQAEPQLCPQPYNAAAVPPPTAFCTIQAWLDIERAAIGGDVTPFTTGSTAQVVYVQRNAPTTAGRLDFDTFQGGADLRIADSTLGADQSLGQAGADASLIGGCGLGASPDIQAPDVANDGNRVAFAARASAADPLGIYIVDINGGNCTRITPAQPMSNGIAVHNFDPAWSPDGLHVVFASTRGVAGASRSRKRFLPQSDLWRVSVTGFTAPGTPEQVTVLSNSEVGPQFMREGRITMTTEKVSAGFYQLAGRRINWDLTDYHPLLGQRKESAFADPADLTSVLPSIGYSSVTDIREGSDGDFLIILSNTQDSGAPQNAGGAGALALFNRSIGPFEANRTDPGYLPSVRVLNNQEIWRGPVSLPDGRILVSKASSPTSGSFDLYMFNPRSGAEQKLFGSNAVRVDAQLVYKYPARELYDNRRQLVFGGSAVAGQNNAVVHMPDAPMLFTLLAGNLRRGRPVEEFRRARFLEVLEEGPCPAGACSANTGGIFEQRTVLGRVRLADDGSAKVTLPARKGLVFRLVDGDGGEVVTMGEEHQLGPGESISMGVSESLFDAVCGGCHGSVSGSELDVVTTPDALTNASRSASYDLDPVSPN